jgi:hypothetical protein
VEDNIDGQNDDGYAEDDHNNNANNNARDRFNMKAFDEWDHEDCSCEPS